MKSLLMGRLYPYMETQKAMIEFDNVALLAEKCSLS